MCRTTTVAVAPAWAIIVPWSEHEYARTTAFLGLFSASHVRFRLSLLSSMTSYPAPRGPPKAVKGARDPPVPPYPFRTPSRRPAGACGAGFFSFFTPTTREKSPEKVEPPGRWVSSVDTLFRGQAQRPQSSRGGRSCCMWSVAEANPPPRSSLTADSANLGLCGCRLSSTS